MKPILKIWIVQNLVTSMIMSTKFLLHLLDIKGLPKSYESGYGNTNLWGGSKPDVSNYRPVLVLPMLSTHGKTHA